ncbi:MAG: GTPase, partial [Ramlibacter sp.]
AIVTPVAGTTRDVVSQAIQIEGVPVHIIDTAGLRDSADPVEMIGIERAWNQIGDADAVLFLHDLTRAEAVDYTTADAQISQALARKLPAGVPVLHVWNKRDAVSVAAAPATGLMVSARTGEGLQALRQSLLEQAGWLAAPEGVYIARQRHVQALERVDGHLAQAASHIAQQAQALDLLAEELRLGQNALNDITGEFSADDLLGVIFSSFCIGK